MATTTKTKTHILVIPYPAQGHMIPLLDFTHHLATTNNFTITILTTPKNLHILSPLLSSHPSTVLPLVLPFPSDSGLPTGVENTKDLPPGGFRQVMFAMSRLEDPLCHWFHSQNSSSAPVAVISDSFLGWTHRFATNLGIKRIVFSASGAMALSVIYSLWRDMPKEEDYGEFGDVLFPDVPSSPKYPWRQLSTVFRSYVKGEAVSELIKEGFDDNMASWGLVINTFDDLERDYLGYLKDMLGHDRVWAVGPLVHQNGLMQRGGSASIDVSEVVSWLDTCRDGEVVYVSFGTQAVLTNQQMEAVAEALERSGVRFIWTVKNPTSEVHHGELPQGFEDRMAGRGIVIKGWAPQAVLLNHQAVGAFLTHCGWNSILEAIMAGVPLLTWPMGADQLTNTTLLADQLKIGVRVCAGSKSVPDSTELAKAFSEPQVDRQRMAKLQNDSLEAVKSKGTSSKELERLVTMLTELRTQCPNPTKFTHLVQIDK